MKKHMKEVVLWVLAICTLSIFIELLVNIPVVLEKKILLQDVIFHAFVLIRDTFIYTAMIIGAAIGAREQGVVKEPYVSWIVFLLIASVLLISALFPYTI